MTGSSAPLCKGLDLTELTEPLAELTPELELMLLVVDMEATEQLEERSSLLPPLEAVEVVDRLSEVNTPTRSPVSGFTASYQIHSSVNTPRNLSLRDSVLQYTVKVKLGYGETKADQYY